MRSLQAELRAAIRGGRLHGGDRLPSTRALASELGVSRAAVVEAYAQLLAEGYLVARVGSGTHVAEGVSREEPVVPVDVTPPEIEFDFRPGVPDVGLFPWHEWTRATLRIARNTRHDVLGYGDQSGDASLRAALAAYLGRARGVAALPSAPLITTGYAQALTLLCRTLAGAGIEAIGMEDPGPPPGHRQAVERAGLRIVPIPVDRDGVDVDAVRASGVRAVVTTPSHQYPTGAVCSPARRAALVAWARAREALIVEDDYDGEFRYDRQPVGAVQGLAPDRVAYVGSASKLLAPGLRLGWLVPPPWLAGPLAAEKRVDDYGTPVLDQLVLAEMLGSGALARHLRRVRAVYRARRDAVVDALRVHLAGRPIHGVAAGLQVLIELAPETSESALVRDAYRDGLYVRGLDFFRARAGSGEPGLVLGFGGLSEARLVAGVARLAPLVRRAERDGDRRRRAAG